MLTREEIARVHDGAGNETGEVRAGIQAVCTMALALLDVAELVPGSKACEDVVKRLRGMDETFGACQMALHSIEELVPGEGDIVERVRRLCDGSLRVRDDRVADIEAELEEANRLQGIRIAALEAELAEARERHEIQEMTIEETVRVRCADTRVRLRRAEAERDEALSAVWWGIWCEQHGSNGFWRTLAPASRERYETTRTEALRVALAMNEHARDRTDSLGWSYEARPIDMQEYVIALRAGITTLADAAERYRKAIEFPVAIGERKQTGAELDAAIAAARALVGRSKT